MCAHPVSVPQTTFFGWDGNRQVLIEQGDNHIHTIYEPNSFVPLVRIEGKKAEPVVSLERKIKEHYQVNITAKSIAVIEQIERELRTDKLTKQHQQMLREIGLSVEELRKLLDPEPTMEGKTIHHFINDHLGTPQFLINQDLQIDWYLLKNCANCLTQSQRSKARPSITSSTTIWVHPSS